MMISKFEVVHSRFDALEAGIPVMGKIAGLELRLAEVERKLSVRA